MLAFEGTKVWDVPLWLFVIGIAGQAMFFGRFLVQWLASERERKVVIPVAFWYMSLLGGLVMIVYGIGRGDPVIILGQLTGSYVYVRNLYFHGLQRGTPLE
jgi:lipid-A-disaccharide synthase-like uncharacterized protein